MALFAWPLFYFTEARRTEVLSVGGLHYTGLRVSELVALRRDQYDGRYLLNVRRKGKARSRELYVSAECRRLLNDYLNVERPRDAPGAGAGAGAGCPGRPTSTF